MRDEIEVGGAGINLEVHDTTAQMVHIKGIDKLVVLIVAGRSNVNDFPVDGAWKFAKAFEGDVEVEGVSDAAGVVSDSDIVYMELGHV